MFSNKENVNILTALLVAHGVQHAVVCPGSRNAAIVHNLDVCPDIACHPVTDERSAAFYALGMAQVLAEPVVVCVTSGTALLNVAPAVAEAYYQHLPLVVVSADRPAAWIGQLDGQTLPQQGALAPFVRRSVTLPEPRNADERWYCNRLVNEALLDATADDHRPVHINVPLTEPLFGFDVVALPAERVIVRHKPGVDYGCLPAAFVDDFMAARRPMIVFGQVKPQDFEGCGVDYLFSHVIVLHESLANFPSVSHFDEVLSLGGMPLPDLIVYVGDVIVSKRLRQFLRQAKDAATWRISSSGDVEDTFCNLRGLIVGDAEFVLQALDQKMGHRKLPATDYRRQWLHALQEAAERAVAYVPPFSQMAAVRAFEQRLSVCGGASAPTVHYANSMPVRLANIYARHHVWCNRGVNGIEGSLSTAAGCSLVAQDTVFCVIGDLSFFYDQNALWNQHLSGNLRILLLNNGRGGIFDQLPGLDQSAARHRLIAGQHTATAEGICRQNGVDYLSARTMDELTKGIDCLLATDAPRPLLLEVFTDPATDAEVVKRYLDEQK
ncbi:MAG: 2-succinyl-5-enolpyruvyl-6-hydroxy-3-cyclohexene-1-carboxylic-acid synthase [Prevotella sp.]|nr:2-succinyl-5-enolpyruvyl-6-hydroxy-3-cyclohexene-1-carboxylic-acid synthase [Prevotella sp.]